VIGTGWRNTDMLNIGIPELLVLVIVFVFGLGGTILWIWMLVDCATKEPSEGNEKVVWILVIVLTHWLGALLYLLIRRPQRVARYGS
jgi:hypothetical protein